MSNSPGTKASRHEAVAFAAVGQILGVDIRLADDNGQNSIPDGKWEAQDQTGIIEVTALPDEDHMCSWAKANAKGEQYNESGSAPTYHEKLHDWIREFLAQAWAADNIRKLTAQEASVRHLYLHAYSDLYRERFNRLSDTFVDYPRELIGDFKLPDGIESVWFEGRAARVARRSGTFRLNMARFDRETGWNRYQVLLDEAELPSANPLPGLRDR